MKKELYQPYFKGKKITIMGLGVLGRGIGDTQFLAEQGAELIVTDKKTENELRSALGVLKIYPNIDYHLGGHELSDFKSRDFVLKAAGVPLDSEFIFHAKEKSVPVYMSASLMVKIVKEVLKDVTVIGVTGTRGKSTTTHLIHHILVTCGKRVHLGGNVRGLANLPLLNEIESGDFVVLELDSWQLQGFEDMKLSPDIAVFTSFLDDHLNYYKGDKELYFKDKSSIYHNQKNGVLIASAQAAEEIKKRDTIKIIVPEVGLFESNLLGKHNDVSLSLAYEVGKQLDLSEEQIKEAIRSFQPVEGRLEYMGLVRGVYIYNDNNATTPDATIAGIEAIIKKYGVKPILICGGSDKGLSLVSLEREIKEKTKVAILLAGTGTDKLQVDKTHIFETLPECTHAAFKDAVEGDVILFSPGFASFSLYFKNEYERNDSFIKTINEYK